MQKGKKGNKSGRYSNQGQRQKETEDELHKEDSDESGQGTAQEKDEEESEGKNSDAEDEEKLAQMNVSDIEGDEVEDEELNDGGKKELGGEGKKENTKEAEVMVLEEEEVVEVEVGVEEEEEVRVQVEKKEEVEKKEKEEEEEEETEREEEEVEVEEKEKDGEEREEGEDQKEKKKEKEGKGAISDTQDLDQVKPDGTIRKDLEQNRTKTHAIPLCEEAVINANCGGEKRERDEGAVDESITKECSRNSAPSAPKLEPGSDCDTTSDPQGTDTDLELKDSGERTIAKHPNDKVALNCKPKVENDKDLLEVPVTDPGNEAVNTLEHCRETEGNTGSFNLNVHSSSSDSDQQIEGDRSVSCESHALGLSTITTTVCKDAEGTELTCGSWENNHFVSCERISSKEENCTTSTHISDESCVELLSKRMEGLTSTPVESNDASRRDSTERRDRSIVLPTPSCEEHTEKHTGINEICGTTDSTSESGVIEQVSSLNRGTVPKREFTREVSEESCKGKDAILGDEEKCSESLNASDEKGSVNDLDTGALPCDAALDKRKNESREGNLSDARRSSQKSTTSNETTNASSVDYSFALEKVSMDTEEESLRIQASGTHASKPNTPGVVSLDDLCETRAECEDYSWCADDADTLRPQSLTVGRLYEARSDECSVMSCLSRFCQPEVLDGRNKYACGKCTKLRQKTANGNSAGEESSSGQQPPTPTPSTPTPLFSKYMKPKLTKAKKPFKLPCDWSLSAQPISIRKAQSRNKAHKPLRTSYITPKNVSVMFDNHTILLF